MWEWLYRSRGAAEELVSRWCSQGRPSVVLVWGLQVLWLVFEVPGRQSQPTGKCFGLRGIRLPSVLSLLGGEACGATTLRAKRRLLSPCLGAFRENKIPRILGCDGSCFLRSK